MNFQRYLVRSSCAFLAFLLVVLVGLPARANTSPAPLAYPSSVIEKGMWNEPAKTWKSNPSNYAGYNNSLKTAPKSLPASVSSPKGGPAAIANAGAAVFGFTGAYWLANQAGSVMFGADAMAGTTGDFFCDIQLVFAPNAGCAATQTPSVDWVPNGDLDIPLIPGYFGAYTFPFTNQYGGSYVGALGSITATVGGSLSVTASMTNCQYGSSSSSTGGYQITTVAITSDGYVYRPSSGSYSFSGGGGTVRGSNSAPNLPPCGPGGGLDWQADGLNPEITTILIRGYESGLSTPPSLPSRASQATVTWEDFQQFYEGYYHLEGTTLRERSDESLNPERWWRVDYQCKASNGTLTNNSVTSAPFREADAQWPAMPAMPCEAGSLLRSFTWSKVHEGGEDVIQTWTMPAEQEQAISDLPAECIDGLCILDLRKVISQSQTVSCFSQPDLCVNWYTSPTKVQDFQCTYGGEVVALSECTVYRPTFNPTTVTIGEHYGDPVTGETPTTADPASELKDQGKPSTNTGPTPGGESNQTGECYPRGWGAFNPLEWIVKPLKCVFIPDTQAIQQTITQTQTLIAEKPPFTLVPAVSATMTGFSEGNANACSGNIADFDPDQQGRLAIPCNPSFGPAWTVLYTGMQAVIVASTVWSLRSMIVSSLNGRGGGS